MLGLVLGRQKYPATKLIPKTGRTSDKIHHMSTNPENAKADDFESPGLAVPGHEDPLEKLLDSESDEDFGDALLVEHLDENSQPLVLRNWTAKDFADIYVRFYPHVLRQAKRYLTNHSQAEEVTQDAFLYLMTSLPEVDSEVGVLKLLKWKTRFLALDVIRSNSGAKFAPLDEQLELSVDDSELSLELERADDAAIVAMALAKLEPRQREALVASLYEEKATSEVAGQLGLNENATRQLVFRAKAAFKKALVGEAETRGLTLSEILSVAARKASKDAGKYVSAASALLLVLAVSIGILPNLGDTTQQVVAGGAAGVEELSPSAPSNTQEGTESDPQLATSETVVAEEAEVAAAGDAALVVAVEETKDQNAVSNSAPETSSVDTIAAVNVQLASSADLIDYSPFDPWLLDPLVEKGVIETSLLGGRAIVGENAPSLLTIVSGEGIWADVTFQPSSTTPFQRVTMGIQLGGQQYFADVTTSDFIVLASDASSETYVMVGTIDELRDTAGNTYSQTRLDGAEVRVSVTFNSQTGEVSQTNLALQERS